MLKRIEVDDEAVEKARLHARHFVLITDHLDKAKWPDKRILQEYRHQRQVIEGHCGFRWIKGPASVAPMFLKTPSRIAALGLVFVLALMVRNYIQAVVRQGLAKMPDSVTLPDMDGKKTRTPTTENVFWLFRNAAEVIVKWQGVEVERRLCGLDEHCDLTLELLGSSSAQFLVPENGKVRLQKS